MHFYLYLFLFLNGKIMLAVVFASFMGFTLSLVKGGVSSNEDKRKMYLIITKARRRGIC